MRFKDDSILLVLPVPFRRDIKGNLLVEMQAANGLERWAENFQHLVVACPCQPTCEISVDTSADYIGVDCLASRNRIEFLPLPWAYSLGSFLKAYRRTQKLLADKISNCKYLSFAIGGLVGDWASVAALEAIHQKRQFSIWTDRVEHLVIQGSQADAKGLKKIYHILRNNLVTSPLMKHLEKYIISRCDLGLFHGLDCLAAYSSYCHNPHLVHDIHLKPEDRIGSQAMSQKLTRVAAGEPLKLLYVGRVAEMKGPLDWIGVMSDLNNRGVAFYASWIGDGPLLTEARDKVTQQNLNEVVEFSGYVGNRDQLLQAIQKSDLFIFCHKTPESPRCLIESLMSGSPILGYSSSYSQDLLGDMASRLLVNRDNFSDLAAKIAYFDKHRDELIEITKFCHELGAKFSDEAVFKHRSNLIKYYLT